MAEQRKMNKTTDVNKARVRKNYKTIKPTTMRAGGMLEYKMADGLYQEMVREAKKKNIGDIQQFLCDYVNQEFGLLGTCVRVISE